MGLKEKNKLIKIYEQLSKIKLNEIDWEDTFSDVKKECIRPEELKEYFNKILSDYYSDGKTKRKKRDSLFIHNKMIKFDEKGDIDLVLFIQDITAFPDEILSQNTKMIKSSNENVLVLNIGIPALKGLVYDIDNKKFYVVTTCPGAGSCTNICYARRGRYIYLSQINKKQSRILNLLLNYPEKFKELLLLELKSILLKNKDKKVVLRWNDAGDFFSKKYFSIASEITKELKESGYNFESYAHTKMGDIINLKDPNINLSFSVDATKSEFEKIEPETTTLSIIVPLDLFKDLFIRKGSTFLTNDKNKMIPKFDNSIDILKERISNKYNIDKNSIFTYNEMKNKPILNKKTYNVIVMPKGDGDILAHRNDIKNVFLLYH